MKVLCKKSELCTACHECEKVCSQTWFKEQDSAKSRIKISRESETSKVVVCSQCGECIDVCPTMALARDKNGVVQVNKNKCVGCYMCVGFCPEGAMFMRVEQNEPFKCVACGQCAKTCPTNTIFISQEA